MNSTPPSSPRPFPSVHDLLDALGHRPTDRISISSRKKDGNFLARVETVASLTRWQPPVDRNVYFGANPVSTSVPLGRKGTEADVTRIYCLFADLDVKEGGFDTLDECREVVDRLSRMLGVNPTAIIESGHGLQPLYRIASPRSCSNVIGSGSNRLGRDVWAQLYDRWGGAVQHHARQVRPDVDIDFVYNLDRILRCPGSVNTKATPTPVRTLLFPQSGALTWRRILKVLDRDNIRGLKGTTRAKERLVREPLSEAIAFINAQPGALADEDELLAIHPSRTMAVFEDRRAVVRSLLAGYPDDASVHGAMLRKVQHALLLSCENKAGLALALDVIRDAYLEVMELRRSGKAPGEARSDADALNEFYLALPGAVAAAKARGNSPAPQRTSDGRIDFRYRVDTAGEA